MNVQITKTFKPVTPSLRHKISINRREAGQQLWKEGPFKALTGGRLKQTGGRNHHGKITIRHRGGSPAHKRKYRTVAGILQHSHAASAPVGPLRARHGRLCTGGALRAYYYANSEIVRVEYNPNSSGYLLLCKTIREAALPEGPLAERGALRGEGATRGAPAGGDVYYVLAPAPQSSPNASRFGVASRPTGARSAHTLPRPGGLHGGADPREPYVGDIMEGLYYKDLKQLSRGAPTGGASNGTSAIGPSNGGIRCSAVKLKDVPAGSKVYNLELIPGRGGQIGRAAGVSCTLVKNFIDPRTGKNSSVIRLPSKKIIVLSSECVAFLGNMSNPAHFNTVLGKAGASRWLGIRPTVRGEAMNPIDHPHGGKTRGSGGLGKPAKTKWGKLAKAPRRNAKGGRSSEAA